jgi:hypothetical protein
MSSGGVNPSRHTACVFFVVGKNYRLQDIQLSKSRTGLENTGLEPVTSWLQTRRSPS